MDDFFKQQLAEEQRTSTPALTIADDSFTSGEATATAAGGEDELPPVPPHRINPLAMTTAVLTAAGNEPKSFKEATTGAYSEDWRQATNEELEAHRVNETWFECDRPRNVTPLTTKWVFTHKRDKNGNVERFKARLVARGFDQRKGIDYNENFAPAAKIESISAHGTDSHQTTGDGSSTTILHGEVEETVFIEPPEGVTAKRGNFPKLLMAL